MPTSASPTDSSFSRPTWAEIDLSALRHNARCLAALLKTHLLAVIKANAYGHGAVEVARALLQETEETPEETHRVKMLGVASVDEGEQLREAGVDAPILLLSAILPDEAHSAVRAGLTPTLFTRELAQALEAAAQRENRAASVHLKIDTGMGRLGVAACEAASFYHSLREFPHLQVTGIYTHFACADEEDDMMTNAQLANFENALAECGIRRNVGAKDVQAKIVLHAANSAAALRYAEARFDLARTGIALYGARPSLQVAAIAKAPLRSVMSLKSRVTFVKQVPRGATISYGATWRAARDSRIATVPIGYADGYLRCLSNRAEALLRGVRVPIVGRVTMDQILLDCTNLRPHVGVGEGVTLWGRDESGSELPVEEAAAWAETIPYELLCGVAHRVPRVYLNGSAEC